MMTFQRGGSQILEKPSLGCKTGKRILKRFTHLKGAEIEFTAISFLK